MKFLDRAAAYARTADYDPTLYFHLCAVIVRGGKILSVGYNNRHGSAMQEYYRVDEFCVTQHAEVDAVLGARRKIDLTGAKIYIARTLLDDTENKPRLGLALPCEMCRAVLFAYGISRAIYTIDNNSYGVLKITDPKKALSPCSTKS